MYVLWFILGVAVGAVAMVLNQRSGEKAAERARKGAWNACQQEHMEAKRLKEALESERALRDWEKTKRIAADAYHAGYQDAKSGREYRPCEN